MSLEPVSRVLCQTIVAENAHSALLIIVWQEIVAENVDSGDTVILCHDPWQGMVLELVSSFRATPCGREYADPLFVRSVPFGCLPLDCPLCHLAVRSASSGCPWLSALCHPCRRRASSSFPLSQSACSSQALFRWPTDRRPRPVTHLPRHSRAGENRWGLVGGWRWVFVLLR